MTTISFEFDVAFSFLQQDENTAIQLNNLLKNRIKTFLYSEQQKKLAGRDGEELFNQVFSKESRIVVVLYRNNWGKTPWTKIEETAIRNRGYEVGYDFVTFVPLDKPVIPPGWLPKPRLWVGLERWGLESAASVIESRVQEFGGNIKVETIADKVRKAQDEIKESKNRKEILTSSKGLFLVQEEYKKLIKTFKHQIKDIKSTQPDWQFNIRNNHQQGIDIISYGYSLIIYYYPYATNTPEGTYIQILLWEGLFNDRGAKSDPFGEYQNFGEDRLNFDINNQNEYGWCNRESGSGFKLTTKLVEFWLTKLLDQVKKYRLQQSD